MANANPETVLANVAVHLAEECRDYDAKPIEIAGAGAHPNLGMLLTCGLHTESNKGEVSLLRGIAGTENFFLLRKTWRTSEFSVQDDPPVSLEERKFWLGYLAYLRLCDPLAEDCSVSNVAPQ